ncbi:MAG: hypothetical protein ACOX56_06840 [Acholeplasmataceae bacterium]|jgi:hypothetical protein
MKWFFRGLLIILGIIILIPILMVVMLIDNSKAPVDIYRDPVYESVDANSVFAEAMDDFLEDSENNDFAIELSQDKLNVVIYQILKSGNENYLVDDQPQNKYLLEEGDGAVGFGVVGVWTKVKEDKLTVKARIDLTKPVKIGTSVELEFKLTFNVKDHPELMKLELTSAKIGNLPLPKKLVNTILQKANISLKDLIEPNLKRNDVTFGTFDEEKWEATIDKIKLLESTLAGSGQDAMVTIFKMLTYNKWLDVKFEKSKVKLALKTTELYFNHPMDHVPELQRLRTEAEKDAMLKSKGTTFLLSGLNSGDGELYIKLSELEINKLLDYYLAPQELEQTIEFGDRNYILNIVIPTIEIYTQGEYFEGTGLHLNIKLELYDQARPAKKFITTMMVQLLLEHDDNDLTFGIGKLRVGENMVLTEEETATLLEMFGATELISENMLVINNFLNNFASQYVEPKGAPEILDNHIKLFYQQTSSGGAVAGIMDTVRNGILGALGSVNVDNEQVQNIIETISATAAGEVTDEQVQDLLNSVDTNLTPEEISALQDQLVEALGTDAPNVEDLLALAGAGGIPGGDGTGDGTGGGEGEPQP